MTAPVRSSSRPRPALVLVGGTLLGVATATLLGWLLGGWSGLGLLPQIPVALLAGASAGALVLARFHRRGTLARRPTEFAGIGVLAACVALLVVAVAGALLLGGDLRVVPWLLWYQLVTGQLVVLGVTHLVMAALLRPAPQAQRW